MQFMFLLLLLIPLPSYSNEYRDEDIGSGVPPSSSDVLIDTPRFVVRLPDNNLLCFAIDGFELFTYNLITSHYLVVNGFLNLVEYHHQDNLAHQLRKDSQKLG